MSIQHAQGCSIDVLAEHSARVFLVFIYKEINNEKINTNNCYGASFI